MTNENTNERNEAAQDEMLASILQKLSSSSSGASSPPGDLGAGSQQQNPIGDIISSVLSNPELLAKLPSLLSSIKPIMDMLGGMGTSGVSAPASVAVPQNSQSSVPAAVMAKQSNKGADSRTALLCAMKPYLSHDRQNAIDYIIKLGRLGDILKTL